MAELRLMETDDIQECTELYPDAFHHEGETKEKCGQTYPHTMSST